MRRSAIFAFSFLLTFGSSVGEVQAVDGSADVALADSIAFRQKFGLPTDPATVRAVIEDPANQRPEFPLPLAADEYAEMNRRMAMEDQMTPLEVTSEKLPGFAGHWIDQPAGGIIRIAFAGGSERHRSELATLTPAGAELDLVDVTYTLAELEAVNARIRAEVEALIAAGVNVGHYYVDITRNKLVVGVRDLTDAATATLLARFGDVVVTEASAPAPTGCSSRENCIGPPLRAGISGAPAGSAREPMLHRLPCPQERSHPVADCRALRPDGGTVRQCAVPSNLLLVSRWESSLGHRQDLRHVLADMHLL